MATNREPTDPDPAANGPAKPRFVKPPPPPELAGCVFEKVPPEWTEEFLRTWDEQAFLAEMEETLRTGGVPFEQIMAKIQRKLHDAN